MGKTVSSALESKTGFLKHLLNGMLSESKEQFIQVVKTFKADEGLKQNVEKLDRYPLSLKNKQE